VIEPFAEGSKSKIGDKTSSPQLPHPAQILGYILDVVQNLASDDDVESLGTASNSGRARDVSRPEDRARTLQFGSPNCSPADIKPMQLMADTHQISGLMPLCAADLKQGPDLAELPE
jgi:hypothetical protein